MPSAMENELPSQISQGQGPLSSGEFVTTVSHFHRAEIARMAGWRDRIDRTTNWAITVVAAMLSLSLSTPNAHHGVLIFAMLLILLLLWIEARRYRFFDVYRARVRQIERHYFAQIFSPRPDSCGELAGDPGRKPARAALSDLLPRGLRQAAAPQLHLHVPDPAARLGAEDLDAQPAGRGDGGRSGPFHFGSRRERSAWGYTWLADHIDRRGLLRRPFW